MPAAFEEPWRTGSIEEIGLTWPEPAAYPPAELPAVPVTLANAPVVVAAGQGLGDEAGFALAERLEQRPELAGIELNVSCPNVAGGMRFATDSTALKQLVEQVRAVVQRCALITKLSPNVTDIRPLAAAAVEAGTDAVSLINTLSGMVVDVANRRAALGNVTGGLSGPSAPLPCTWSIKPGGT